MLEDIGEDFSKVDTVAAAEAAKLMEEYAGVMPEELPKTWPPSRGVQHVIEVIPGQVPLAANYHRIPKSWDDALQKQLQELKGQGLIRESTSPYGAPMLFVNNGHSHTAIIIEGLIAKELVKVLIDSGATSNFVSWVYSHQVKTQKVSGGGPRVEVADGRVKNCTEKIQEEFTLEGHCSNLTAYLFPLKSFDLVLGMAWLQAAQHSINWRKREVVFTTSHGDVVQSRVNKITKASCWITL